jgi:hypothetical protein
MKGTSGQIHTIEGITAAGILLIVLLFITQSITFVAPQTEKSVDMGLSVTASDILATLNTGNEYHPSELKEAVEGWDGRGLDEFAAGTEVVPGMECLDEAIEGVPLSNLPPNVRYCVWFYYDEAGDGTGWTDKPIIAHGAPHDNAITSSKMITLNVYDDQYIDRSDYWYGKSDRMPVVVVVRLSLWYV